MKRFLSQAAAFILTGILSTATAAAEEGDFSADQLEQLVAPIALYPDDLLSQTMMAATYPLEIVQASRWREKNKGLSGTALDQAMEAQPWEPSVKSLVAFPETLALLNDNLDWTQDLGDAVLGQQDDVMEAVQRMRDRARAQGNLSTTNQQTVVVEKETILIRPANPQVVYVPVYNPVIIYGPAWRPFRWYYPCYGYPPSYWYRGRPISNAISFTAGVAIGGILFGGCNWYDRHFYVRPSAFSHPWYRGYNGIKVSSTRNVTWSHNPVHRNGVHYHNQSVTNQYLRPGSGQTITRPGYDRPVARPITPTRPSVNRPVTLPATRPTPAPGQLTKPTTRPSVSLPANRPTTLPATRPTPAPGQLTKPTTRPSVSVPTSRPTTRPSYSGGAFNGSNSASASRAASSRGARSTGGRSSRR